MYHYLINLFGLLLCVVGKETILKDSEKDIILFVYRFKIVLSTNIKYLLSNKKYYQVIVKRLVDNGYLRRYKTKYLMLGQTGKKYIKILGYNYSKPSYKKEYVKKMTTISNLAIIAIGNKMKFIASFELKDDSSFRTQSRPFIGSIKFNGNNFLVYYISKKSSKRFCNSIIYDFQKERDYKQAILFIEDIRMINLGDYAFGSNQFVVFPLLYENWITLFSEQFKIDYRAISEEFGYSDTFLSKWDFCDYETRDKKFITFLPFIDAEKIYKLKMFCEENKEYIEKLHVFCSKDVFTVLKENLPAIKNVTIVDFKDYIKDLQIYLMK